jgi:rubrerythrin
MTPINSEILNALTTGISAEIASYVFYLEAAKRPEAAEFRKTLEDLALEEKKHFRILERQHHSLITSEQWISLADVLKGKGLPEINEQMTELHATLIDEVKTADSLLTVLDIAYGLEVKAYELYKSQIPLTKSREGKAMFEELAKFERGHMKLIDDMRKKLE